MQTPFSFLEPSLGTELYLSRVLNEHAQLSKLIDMEMITPWLQRRNLDLPNEFGSHDVERGDLYRKERESFPMSRPNIQKLVEVIETDNPKIVYDLIGGNGHLATIRQSMSEQLGDSPLFITSDAEHSQIMSAVQKQLPAIRQPAQDTIFLSGSADAVFFAYGTHHIPVVDRPGCWREAHRILKKGGRVVVQDFENESSTAKWYSEVIHKWSLSGHDYDHFNQSEMVTDLSQCGFVDVSSCQIDDSFVVRGKTKDLALADGIKHICTLFGLVKLMPEVDSTASWLKVLDLLSDYFVIPSAMSANTIASEIKVTQVSDEVFEAIFPRVSIVATGVK